MNEYENSMKTGVEKGHAGAWVGKRGGTLSKAEKDEKTPENRSFPGSNDWGERRDLNPRPSEPQDDHPNAQVPETKGLSPTNAPAVPGFVPSDAATLARAIAAVNDLPLSPEAKADLIRRLAGL